MASLLVWSGWHVLAGLLVTALLTVVPMAVLLYLDRPSNVDQPPRR